MNAKWNVSLMAGRKETGEGITDGNILALITTVSMANTIPDATFRDADAPTQLRLALCQIQ
jgi:hypothetical protein